MPFALNYAKIQTLLGELYPSESSDEVLYHYTSLSVLMKIVETRRLWVSDVRYMNDASEVNYGADLIRSVAKSDAQSAPAASIEMLGQWGTYVGCFTSEGSLLSQWRGYCPTGLGVSIGFRSGALAEAARKQEFRLGRCIYEPNEQRSVVSRLFDAIEEVDMQPLSQDEYYDKLVEHPERLLKVIETVTSFPRIAALLKNPEFREEKECRLVSENPAHRPPQSGLRFRPGGTMLIPYVEFELPSRENGTLDIEHIWLGPTSHPEQSKKSLSEFLKSSSGTSSTQGVTYCGIPLRNA